LRLSSVKQNSYIDGTVTDLVYKYTPWAIIRKTDLLPFTHHKINNSHSGSER